MAESTEIEPFAIHLQSQSSVSGIGNESILSLVFIYF